MMATSVLRFGIFAFLALAPASPLFGVDLNEPSSDSESTLDATPIDDTHLLLSMSGLIAPAPVEPPVPGQLWQGWGVDPQATPAQSCDGFFANIPRTPLACYPETPPAEETINTLPAGELAYRALALTKSKAQA